MAHVAKILVIFIFFTATGTIYAASSEDTLLSKASSLIVKWGISARKGQRTTMEDSHAIAMYEGQTIYGIFDGHRGDAASSYAAAHLLPAIHKYGEEKSYILIDKQIEALGVSGTTAVTARIETLSNGSQQLTVGWVGDSRAVLVKKDGSIRFATKGHRPEDLSERKRIELAGGCVYLDRTEYVSRVASTLREVNGLGVARALGDVDWVNDHVSPTPDIKVLTLEPNEDAFLILACDGVWDFMNDELAAFIVAETLREKTEVTADEASGQDGYQTIEEGNDLLSIMAARSIRDGAYVRKSNDNISAMLLCFVWQDKATME
jgi:protein phosphatase PTC1